MDSLEALRDGRLTGARRLDLACGLTAFPREIFALADSLEVLNLSGNALAALPGDLGRLHRLRVLFCSDNRFTELPPALGGCAALEMVGFKANRIRSVPASALPPKLRWLILTDNEIEQLPDALGDCAQLQKLMLAGNRLRQLPAALAACGRLELLRISANRFEAMPEWLLCLPRLAWLAFGGNPLTAAAETAALAAAATPRIAWDRLALQGQLGEGASGVIHEALWPDAAGNPTVAVKLFKGAVTSDGWPRSEMAACVAAGAHPHLIPVRGRIEAHPDAAQGLVLARIPRGYRNLADPPSLASCTRDVYAEGLRLSAASALRMARGIASAAQQLHERGIVHGDLYAHNMLCDGEGASFLGDFGAASFVPPAPQAVAPALQRIEVRAFGCLLEELAARCDAADGDEAASIDRMTALARRCIQPDVAQRPLFDQIVQALAAPR